MKNALSAFIVGLIFSVGLAIAGMTNPGKVIGFLDLFGNWDPSLAFVMAGAIALHAIAYILIRKRPLPVFSKQWLVPTRKDITAPLIVGSALFGIGWGLAGYCPGPAVVALATLRTKPVIFVLSMLAGMILFRVASRLAKTRKA